MEVGTQGALGEEGKGAAGSRQPDPVAGCPLKSSTQQHSSSTEAPTCQA
jgi:hypothetical protein